MGAHAVFACSHANVCSLRENIMQVVMNFEREIQKSPLAYEENLNMGVVVMCGHYAKYQPED